jgi:hypothetical protein
MKLISKQESDWHFLMSWQSNVDILPNCESILKWIIMMEKVSISIGKCRASKSKCRMMIFLAQGCLSRELDSFTSCKSAVFLQILMSDFWQGWILHITILPQFLLIFIKTKEISVCLQLLQHFSLSPVYFTVSEIVSEMQPSLCFAISVSVKL